MTLATRTLRYANYSLSAIALLLSAGTLYLWARAVIWWGDPSAFASALVWTVLTLATLAVLAVVGRLREMGD